MHKWCARPPASDRLRSVLLTGRQVASSLTELRCLLQIPGKEPYGGSPYQAGSPDQPFSRDGLSASGPASPPPFQSPTPAYQQRVHSSSSDDDSERLFELSDREEEQVAVVHDRRRRRHKKRRRASYVRRLGDPDPLEDTDPLDSRTWLAFVLLK